MNFSFQTFSDCILYCLASPKTRHFKHNMTCKSIFLPWIFFELSQQSFPFSALLSRFLVCSRWLSMRSAPGSVTSGSSLTQAQPLAQLPIRQIALIVTVQPRKAGKVYWQVVFCPAQNYQCTVTVPCPCPELLRCS